MKRSCEEGGKCCAQSWSSHYSQNLHNSCRSMKNYHVFDVYSDFDTNMLRLRLQLLIFCSLHATEGGLKTAAHYANASNALSKRGEICSRRGLLVAVPESAAGPGDTGSISRFRDKESKLHSWSNFKCLSALKCEQLGTHWNNYCSMLAQPVSYECSCFCLCWGRSIDGVTVRIYWTVAPCWKASQWLLLPASHFQETWMHLGRY